MALGVKIPRNALNKGREEFSSNPNGGNNVELEPGTYLGVIKSMKAMETKNGPQMVANILVGGEDVSDEVKGGQISIWFSFDEERVVHLFRFLNKLGYDVSEMDEDVLEEICEKIKEAKHIVRFKSTEKDGYTNYRINKIMDDMTAEEVLGDAAEKLEEEKEEKPTVGKKKDKNKKNEEAEPEAETEPEEEEAEPEAETEPEEETELKVGMKVKTKIKGEIIKVEVTKIDESENKVVVLNKKDGKKYRVSPEALLPA